ncbi:uncharacterized protein L969DRAFT_508240 [Mixia osmundae IAM 14324]|uniref:uncharacterized protein n=1 Tax=Mixia osmundae (strain CBS 9802 / IAM 14324 / JCM 22182 / KY 12970) TaxID=764103 RepID=UPI0004A5480D|nr:uncharacterized protein L969DRAFT_508240 [Mixia osmundae IAM 14324]KEI39088.1 hypothetical protein L969DRAFT_508240 [Mixia osmundae IAM 14324]
MRCWSSIVTRQGCQWLLLLASAACTSYAWPDLPDTRSRCLAFEDCVVTCVSQDGAIQSVGGAQRETFLLRYRASAAWKKFGCDPIVLSPALECNIDSEPSSPAEQRFRLKGEWSMAFRDQGPFAPTLEACCIVERHFTIDLNALSGEWSTVGQRIQMRCPRPGLVEHFDTCLRTYGSSSFLHTCEIFEDTCMFYLFPVSYGKCSRPGDGDEFEIKE